MRWNNTIRSNVALFQAVLFCLIVASGTVFMHKHKTADGRIVIHAHPYNLETDPDANKHHQSDSEIHLLDVIFQGSYIYTPFIHYEQPIVTPSHIAYLPYRLADAQPHDCLHAFLRGPPKNG